MTAAVMATDTNWDPGELKSFDLFTSSSSLSMNLRRNCWNTMKSFQMKQADHVIAFVFDSKVFGFSLTLLCRISTILMPSDCRQIDARKINKKCVRQQNSDWKI